MPILFKDDPIKVQVDKIQKQLSQALTPYIHESIIENNTKEIEKLVDDYYKTVLRDIPYTVAYRTTSADTIEVDLTLTPPVEWISIDFTIKPDGNVQINECY